MSVLCALCCSSSSCQFNRDNCSHHRVMTATLLVFLLTVSFFGNVLCSPSDEMQKFIDECNVMIDTMESCAQGWEDFEEEIIESVDSFAERIVYTESLIMEETKLIQDMAERIVETEEIMIDLVESCNCTKISQHEQTISKSMLNKKHVVQTSSSSAAVPVYLTPAPFHDKKCSAMDYIIEVMDASIQAFEVFNNDFIEVLSYMDSAIQDMGDRIVDTECLIVNMSYQIGDMADRIVETEEMMADMASSCCRAHSALRGGQAQSRAHSRVQSVIANHNRDEGDDLLSHCMFNQSRTTVKTNISEAQARTMIHAALSKLHRSLSTGKTGSLQHISSYLRRGLETKDVMSCESIWDPFCCAAEVCADMMVEMIELMANGADWMTDMCEACIDEIGKLADDIVKTEENIVLMGYAIGDMSDCILVFIDQGLEFMTLFCPSTSSSGSYLSLKGKFGVQSRGSVDEEGCSDSSLLKLKNAIVTVHGETVTIEKDINVISSTWKHQQQLSLKVKSLVRQALDAAVGPGGGQAVQGNPFGEFTEMVETMMRTMTVFTDMMTSQTRLVTDMLESLTHLASEQGVLGDLVVVMGMEVATMGGEIAGEEDAMTELTKCMEE